jgi:aspartyl-tRNA(Asn)/glutamyl-tRNA(Gln) amidotransferase subunit C
MEAPKLDVRYVAQLARLELTDGEIAQFQGQLAQVVGYVAQLNALKLDEIEPTAHAQDVHNVMRVDVARPGLSPADALDSAPASSGGMFLTVRVVE